MGRKKICTGCGRFLYLGEFYKLGKSKNHPDGYDCRCKECRRKQKNDEYARKYKVPDGKRLGKDGRAIEKKGYSVRLYWGEVRTANFKRLFPIRTNKWLAIEFDCSVRTVVRRAREMGLEKSDVWLHSVWDSGLKKAHFINKIYGNKADLTNFIEAGKAHRFKPGDDSRRPKVKK